MKKEIVFGICIPVVIGIVLATLTAVALSMSAIVLYQSEFYRELFKREHRQEPDVSLHQQRAVVDGAQLPNRSAQMTSLQQHVFPFPDARALSVDPRVKQALLTSDITNTQPIDDLGRKIQVVPDHYLRVYWFNQLIDLKGERLFHSWYYLGTLVDRIEIVVKSKDYAASSNTIILPQQQGMWRVVTETLDEKPLITHLFEVSL